MDPAPGFDEAMPHDMVHLVVEAELNLHGGLFGQLAAGGTAGSFRLEAMSGNDRELARERKRVVRKGEALLRQARDSDISEIAAAIFHTQWLARRSANRSARGALAPEIAGDTARLRRSLSREEESLLTRAEARILLQLDRFSEQWGSIAPGHALVVQWPSLDFLPERTAALAAPAG